MAAVTTAAILLRAHPFSESSRVLRFYTRDLGLVGAIARGVRRGASRGRGAAGAFSEGVAVLAVRDNRDLQTLQEFAPAKLRFGLAQEFSRLAGASLAAELVLRHAGQEPHEELYRALSGGLDLLERVPSDAVTAELLALGWVIVQILGFEPELEACVACARPLEGGAMGWFDLEAGGVRGSCCRPPRGARRVGPLARKQLDRLLAGEAPPGLRGLRPHLSLLDDFTAFHMLGGRRLDSFRFLEPVDAGQQDAATED